MAGMTTDTRQESPSPTDTLAARLDTFDRRPEARHQRSRFYALLDREPGSRVVDVGCGTGLAVAELAEQGIRAVGVDTDERMLALARGRHPAGEYFSGDAYRLPFRDGSVDGYLADKVYHSLDDAERALAEARRVLAPGGRIVLAGQDLDGYIIDSDRPELTRTLVHAYADTLPTPHAARRSRALLLAAGFREVTVEAHMVVFTEPYVTAMLAGLARNARSAGVAGAEETEAWVAEQTHRSETGRLLVAAPFLVAAASR